MINRPLQKGFEKYPFNQSSLTAIQKLNETGKTQVKN